MHSSAEMCGGLSGGCDHRVRIRPPQRFANRSTNAPGAMTVQTPKLIHDPD